MSKPNNDRTNPLVALADGTQVRFNSLDIAGNPAHAAAFDRYLGLEDDDDDDNEDQSVESDKPATVKPPQPKSSTDLIADLEAKLNELREANTLENFDAERHQRIMELAEEVEDAKRRRSGEARLKQSLKTRFLRLPFVSESDFNRLYPTIRDRYIVGKMSDLLVEMNRNDLHPIYQSLGNN